MHAGRGARGGIEQDRAAAGAPAHRRAMYLALVLIAVVIAAASLLVPGLAMLMKFLTLD